MSADVEEQAGKPARKIGGRWEIIGPADCPLLYRRTLFSCRFGKLLDHRFVAGASDKDPHDHPRSFVTFVLRGGYDDLTPCSGCDGGSVLWHVGGAQWTAPCGACDGSGFLVDRLRAPAVRFRRAEHAHITHVHDDGARTLVVMGPLRRPWGFWRDRRWWPWRDYELEFGLGFRCDRDEDS